MWGCRDERDEDRICRGGGAPSQGVPKASERAGFLATLALRSEGRTILLTTHYMEEADQLCDRVAIIDQGSIIALDSPRRLKDSVGEGRSLQLEVSDWNDDADRQVRAVQGVAGVIARHAVEQETWQVSVLMDNGSAVLAEIITVLARSGIRIHRVQAVEPTREDVFLLGTRTLLPLHVEQAILVGFMGVMITLGLWAFSLVERRCRRLGTISMH